MSIKNLISRLLPVRMLNRLQHSREQRRLKTIDPLTCDCSLLRPQKGFDLVSVFQSKSIETDWLEAESDLSKFYLPDGTGGVNPGDRRAIFYLARSLKASSVLEIGTHIGASTLHLASAVERNLRDEEDLRESAQLISVDLEDVNSITKKPWLRHGSKHSPEEMTSDLGFKSFVEFRYGRALDFMANCDAAFDLIFLDGDHSAPAVYQEIPAALKLLKQNGVILLHDFFPNGQPLWSDNRCIHGPHMAVDRLRKEGQEIQVLPLGNLPWPTKLGSNFTSLAVVLKA